MIMTFEFTKEIGRDIAAGQEKGSIGTDFKSCLVSPRVLFLFSKFFCSVFLSIPHLA